MTNPAAHDGSHAARITLLHRARRAANGFGIEVRRLHDPLSFESRRLAVMQRLGVDLVIDVGARPCAQWDNELQPTGAHSLNHVAVRTMDV